MSEEEIIERFKTLINNFEDDKNYYLYEISQKVLDLYNKEKLNSLNLSEQLNKEKEKNKNSISKDKIRKDLETCQKVYEKEMKPYKRDYGLDVTYLSKKEKEQLVNKRNCLITQMKTYEMLLEE